MFAAGTDTTFITLDWAMKELINPRVLERAQAEVRSVLGDRSVVLESDLPQLDYMKAVIKRDLPIAPSGSSFSPKRIHGTRHHQRIRHSAQDKDLRECLGDREGPGMLGRSWDVQTGQVSGQHS